MTDDTARIPEGAELALLMRCCGYRRSRSGAVSRDPVPPTAEELAEARRLGWRPGEVVTLARDEAIERARSAARALSREAVAKAFVAGVGGSAPRGRQILISYAWAVHLPPAAEAPDCGLDETVEIDVVDEMVRLALGYVWNEVERHYLLDLEAAARQGLPEPTDSDRAVFDRLLEAIAAQPPGTTPGQLEKVLARAKVLPATDKYSRYGILQALAEVGVMPNPFLPPSLDRHIPRSEIWAASAKVKGGPHSDIVLPLAGWRGEMGIDRTRLASLFG